MPAAAAASMPLRLLVLGTTTLLTFFDDVAAGLHQNGFWQYAQKLASLSRAVCDGDRLECSRCRNELLLQNFQVVAVTGDQMKA